MKKLMLIFIFMVLVNLPESSAQILQKLNGLAVAVDPASHQLSVQFEHPVTRDRSLKVFQILPSTGFKNVKRLEQIKPNDPISIDYEEISKGILQAVYIEVVSLKNLPFDPAKVKRKFLSR